VLPYLEPGWHTEVAHAILHVGVTGAVRRLAAGSPLTPTTDGRVDGSFLLGECGPAPSGHRTRALAAC